MPSNFTSDDLARIAQLARVALTGDELQLFARQLSEFLASAEQVQQIDTTGIPPTSHPTGASSPLREDVERPCLPREAALEEAPDADRLAGLFKVPRVLG